jgi:hypothetical protein
MSPRYLKSILAVVFACLILGYGIFRFQAYLSGPVITIISPKDGETATSSVIMLQGSIKDAIALDVDGSALSPDQNGSFEETLLLPTGLSIITIDAKDRFGAKEEKVIHLYVDETMPISIATSSATTTTN